MDIPTEIPDGWGVSFLEAYLIAEWLLRIGLSIVVLARKRTPSAAIAWLLLIFFQPVIGAIAYFMIGEVTLGRRRIKSYRNCLEQIDAQSACGVVPDPSVINPEIDDRYRQIALLAEAYGACPPLGRNDFSLTNEPQEMIEALVADIDASQRSVHLLYYIFNVDEMGKLVADALRRAQKRGVHCRLLVDGAGSRPFLQDDLSKDLREAGVAVTEALPVKSLRARVERLDLRNHRKVAVIDGVVAYTGSQNISSPYYPGKKQFGAWHDASVRVTGPIVAQLEQLFVQDWYLDTDDFVHEPPIEGFESQWSNPGITAQLLPMGPLTEAAPLPSIILEALHSARNEAVFTTPYFVPDDATIAALRSAARRGIEVHLVVPKKSDNWFAQAAGRSYYGELLDSGVVIHEFDGGLLHSKTLTVDNDFALIGSANLDIRSFLLNFELGLLIYDDNFSSELRYLQQYYMEQSEPLTHIAWKKRGWHQRMGDNLAKLTSPLM
ncbi:MAG: cardiolipin synthase [Phycisphaerales bacterium]